MIKKTKEIKEMEKKTKLLSNNLPFSTILAGTTETTLEVELKNNEDYESKN